ncbi:ATP-binding protein [Comamonas sp. JUb58]|uniref:sacsin N-terminal ATP-binding-like domain-containing protein n=1 Tax=Comamonas sp. JUb58 TaxID=2485114 RepID=UPI0010612073|nr:ATP-binding protein [Comamonas sp. JUb58]TDS68161.1 histidine kinase/DNA gyrase B/HSP90-like ATPase [Comamonas sp. JUb58]
MIQTHISELTGAKVRIFLTEIAEGVSNYRSMHSLTQQVEHQYHGRFLIELVQNAHDTFVELPLADRGNRVEVIFDPDDSPHGSLLVANDGAPFSPSNFERLSQLGQSDKDPEKSIGNKGIGFRSVLEISDSPEIYSRRAPCSATFDGYCFAFRPDVVAALVEPITRLSQDSKAPIWSVTEKPIVDTWSDEMLERFRSRVQLKNEGWLTGELAYLSPYLLPVPISQGQSARVLECESRGFASVVRLPLKSAELRGYVLDRMSELSESTVLFLNKIGSLTIKQMEGDSRQFVRQSSPLEEGRDGVRVAITNLVGQVKEYWVWSTELHAPTAPQSFRSAVAKLPGRWPEITDITVSVAALIGDTPEGGCFSIFLPTRVSTGSAIHINAPFFGDMSRTSIPFDDAYNRHLLDTALDLSMNVVLHKLAGRGEQEARAIVDFLAPFGTGQAAMRWLELVTEAEDRTGIKLSPEPIALADKGWAALDSTSLIPESGKVSLLTKDFLRENATFSVFHRCLDSRVDQLRALTSARFDTGAYPLDWQLAATISEIAKALNRTSGDWNAFWRDVLALLPKGQSVLAEHAVLLGADGKLHRVGDGTRVFFVPRQGTADDSEIGGDTATTGVPATLQSSVAFLSEEVQLYDPVRPAMQTPVRGYLGQGLVSQFRVETIFSEVLHRLTPPLPTPIGGEHEALCRDILGWALRLMKNVIARERGTGTMWKLMRTIPVPCSGGWFPMQEATFSEGWPDTVGTALNTYLTSLKSGSAQQAMRRLLVAPGHAAWGDVGIVEAQLLALGGVQNGMRLVETAASAWSSEFKSQNYQFQLPAAPPTVSAAHWSEFAAVAFKGVTPYYVSVQKWEVGSFYTFPGLAEFDSLSVAARQALSELILQSLPRWTTGLQKMSLIKIGGVSDRLEITSPLTHFLSTRPWLAIIETKGVTWARPRDRWYVPAEILAGRAKHYAHLRALPSVLALNVGQRPDLAKALRELGMQSFDPIASTEDSSLLVALTSVVGSDEVADANVLLGQIRDAWQRFRPPATLPAIPLLPVRRANKRFTSVAPTVDEPVYLPDFGAYVSDLEEFDFPVVTILPSDAKDLRDWFTTAYGSRVQLTSDLALIPEVDGTPWTGFRAVGLADSELGWLIHPLLVMVAMGRGVHAQAFKDRVEILRTARIDWVPNLHVAVKRDGQTLTTSEVPALWDANRKTLVATEGCKSVVEKLANALAQALARDDLEIQLRYLLRGLGSIDSAPEDVTVFLEPLHITPEQVHQVLEHLRGDVGHICRLVIVLMAVVAPEVNSTSLENATTEEEFSAALAAVAVPNLNVSRTIQIARDSQDLFDFGRAISPDFGPAAFLSRWNAALAQRSQPALSNRSWRLQLQAGLEEGATLVKRVIAHAIRTGKPLHYESTYNAYMKQAESLDMGASHWTVEFSDVMHLVCSQAAPWFSDDAVTSALCRADSPEVLLKLLADAGVVVDIDPDECGRKNHALVDAVAGGMDRLRLAAWVKAGADQEQQENSSLVDQYCAAVASPLRCEAFTAEWSETHVFDLMRKGVQHPDMPQFQAAVDASSDLASLQTALKLSADDLDGAKYRLEAIRAERNRRKNIVKICGEDFDASEDNLSQLWDFLAGRISDPSLAASMQFDLTKPATLAPLNPRPKKDGGGTGNGRGGKKPRAYAIDEFVGLAGEIFVFRILQQRYGNESVSASAWVSKNSKHVFSFNQGDDERGCDFVFSTKGKHYRVEVKASSGDDEVFMLGSSEIRLAMEIATQRKRKKEIFLLVHVKNALSAQPSAIVLPNPYDPKHADVYRIEEADARIRYKALG